MGTGTISTNTEKTSTPVETPTAATVNDPVAEVINSTKNVTSSFGDLFQNVEMPSLFSVLQHEFIRNMYCGINTSRNPLDFWVYQSIIWETRPDVIIEIGNWSGGSTLALAHFLDNIGGTGRVIALDIDHRNLAELAKGHPGITWIEGDDLESYDKVVSLIKPGERVMIIEDSNHEAEHSYQLLNKYSGLVTPGCYYIVEDSICGHGLNIPPSPGPFEAVMKFMDNNGQWAVDRGRESMLTWNPMGYLKKL